jgi:pimeloyl-ACP methyl ester carboxylesterase
MLHGGGLMGSTWRRVCENLPGYRCIAPDMRGHGDSDWGPPDDYTLTAYAGDLRQIIEAYGISGKAHLVGMSLGGQVALHAVCHGLPVRSLCLVDVGPTIVRGGGRAIVEFLSHTGYPSFNAALEASMAFNRRRSRESLAESLRRSMRETENGAWIWKWDPVRLTSRDNRADEAETLWPLLGGIDCPVLIVRGEESPIFTAELAEPFAAALPDATLACVADAGHNVQTDQPERLAALLGEFWGGV